MVRVQPAVSLGILDNGIPGARTCSWKGQKLDVELLALLREFGLKVQGLQARAKQGVNRKGDKVGYATPRE